MYGDVIYTGYRIMPFVDSSGIEVEKGVSVTDERTITGVGVAQPSIDMTGLVSVDSVVDVRLNDEEVDEANDNAAEVASISGNTVNVQVYHANGSDDLSTAADGDVSSASLTVVAEGY